LFVKNWFRYIFYASLIFLVVALIRADYLVIPHIHDYPKLAVSLVLLFLGFLINGMSWARVVRRAGFKVSDSEGIASTGLSIFGKYIPGKIWIIMGRAEYLSKKHGYPRKDLGSYSFDAQFIALWAALLLGTIGMFSVKSFDLYGLSVLLLFTILSLVIYTPMFHRIAAFLLSKISGKTVTIPTLPFGSVYRLILWFLAYWGIWCLSFYFLASSLVPEALPFQVSFGFGLAGSLGILAVFAPGGIGVREGILTGFLTLIGLDLPTATTIAVTSRLWYLAGEVFIFFAGWYLHRRGR
jgi:uncharacterized membrane protein YbhN (UPF0104 family)